MSDQPLYVGDLIEAAFWFSSPTEKQEAKRSIRKAIGRVEDAALLSPVTWAELPPDNERAPEPPEGSPRGVMLLVGEAKVLSVKKAVTKPDGFVGQLDVKDLAELRRVTRSAYAKSNPGITLTDWECDQYIERIGPDSALKTLH